MYRTLLISRYLRRRLAPLFAAAAVMLCTAMVIIVISVMGGFLSLMEGAAQRLTGDVVVDAFDISGFPHYEAIIQRLEADDAIAGATPVIQGYGLLRLFGGDQAINVLGVRGESMSQVIPFRETMYWDGEALANWERSQLPSEDWMSEDQRRLFAERHERRRRVPLKDLSLSFELPSGWSGDAGAVLGIEANPFHVRDDRGRYSVTNSALGRPVTLTVLPLTKSGGLLEPAVAEFTIVNEFKSGLYNVDASRVYVDFEQLQSMLLMDEAESYEDFDPITGEPIGEPTVVPARANQVMVRGAAGVTAEEVQRIARAVVDAVVSEHPDMPTMRVRTWRQVHAGLLDAVENEKGLITILFGFISIVAVVMIGVIFSMIVMQKTRDIGILRAIGASRSGVAGIFLGYGLAIGVIGAGLGLGLAYLIVTNLNGIQALLYQLFGFQMWNPRTYYFDRIPDQVDLGEASVIVVVAIISSLIGAIIPAWQAARLNPVESLRYE